MFDDVILFPVASYSTIWYWYLQVGIKKSIMAAILCWRQHFLVFERKLPGDEVVLHYTYNQIFLHRRIKGASFYMCAKFHGHSSFLRLEIRILSFCWCHQKWNWSMKWQYVQYIHFKLYYVPEKRKRIWKSTLLHILALKRNVLMAL